MRNRVREQRTQRGLSQAEVAGALGVSRQTVISIESGLTGFGYLLGLSSYGSAQDGTPGTSGGGPQVQSPVNS
jgi:hypothetical protein